MKLPRAQRRIVDKAIADIAAKTPADVALAWFVVCLACARLKVPLQKARGKLVRATFTAIEEEDLVINETLWGLL